MSSSGPQARTIRLTIAYDGTNYVGWQAQENGPSIQIEVERAIRAVTGETMRVEASGRTDAGVHARGQTVSFLSRTAVPTRKLALALSSNLPKDIAVVEAADMPDGFHARRSAIGKVYRYTIYNEEVRPVLERSTTAHIIAPLDMDAMKQAASCLVGKHDFSSFVTETSERTGHCVRTIKRLEIRRDGPCIQIEVEGDGFLYNMVRAIAGSLIEVGRGKYPPE